RVERGKVPLGTAIFVGLRAFVHLWQRQLLLHSPLPEIALRLGLSSPAAPPAGGLPLPGTGMTPYPSLIWALSIGSPAKHVNWASVHGNVPILLGPVVVIGLLNNAVKSWNTLAFDAPM
ncbi:hypothetical protein A1O1_01719, partial [Capronia coronata CBS 617.96]